MSLGKVSTKALRAELAQREEKERAERWEEVRAAFPCPRCGGDPESVESNMTEEHVQAPRDPDGVPMLYMPYEAGEVIGGVWETVVRCVNGHETRTEQHKFFEKPMGPPRLHRGAR